MSYIATEERVAFEAIRGERDRQAHLTALIPLVTLYLALAFYQIENQSLWTDEVISLNAAVSLEPIWNVWFNSQCPLYYVLLRVWTKAVGTTEFALRSLSAVLGAVAVCLIYAIGLRLFNRRTAVVAALFLTTSPFFIWYSQEVRYINLMLVTSLLATYSFYRAISVARLGWWVSYTAASVLAAFSFVSVIFLFIAQGLYLLWSTSGRTVLSKWIVCQLVTFTLFAAWFGAVYSARLGPGLMKTSGSISVRHTPDQEVQQVFDLASTIPYTFFAFSTGFSLGPSVRELHISRSINTLLNDAAAVIPVGILFATIFVLGFAQLQRQKGVGIFILLWLAIPILFVLLVAAMTSFGRYNVRYVAVALPAYFLILASGIYAFRNSTLRIGLLSAVLIANGLSIANYYFDTRYARADARAAARYLESMVRHGDIILSVGNITPLQYYVKDGLPIMTLNGHGSNNDSAIVEDLRQMAKGHDRLWLVEIRPWETDSKRRVKAMLDSLARPAEQKKFPGVEIYSYQLSDSRS